MRTLYRAAQSSANAGLRIDSQLCERAVLARRCNPAYTAADPAGKSNPGTQQLSCVGVAETLTEAALRRVPSRPVSRVALVSSGDLGADEKSNAWIRGVGVLLVRCFLRVFVTGRKGKMWAGEGGRS